MASAPAAAQPALPEEILEEIFLRLDAAADLTRASAACSTFRRVVSARRFRSLHSPPILGLLDGAEYRRSSLPFQRFFPVEERHRAAPAARALAEAADFTFSFVPDPCSWRPRDALDGRVVLSRRVASGDAFEDLVVCDPLHRRYVQIPPIPDDLAASAVPEPRLRYFRPYLIPAGEDDDGKGNDEEALSFRIICVVRLGNKHMAFVFSSAKQEWRVITFLCSRRFGYQRFSAHGCFYWMDYVNQCSLVLDTQNLKFSILDLPPNHGGSQCAIVEAGEGRLGLLTLRDDDADHLFCKTWHNNVVGAEEWQHHKTIPLPNKGVYSSPRIEIEGSSERYLRLWLRYDENLSSHFFALDLKTWLFERLGEMRGILGPVLDYASFPSPLAPPTI